MNTEQFIYWLEGALDCADDRGGDHISTDFIRAKIKTLRSEEPKYSPHTVFVDCAISDPETVRKLVHDEIVKSIPQHPPLHPTTKKEPWVGIP